MKKNKSNRNFRTAIHHMSMSKWTISAKLDAPFQPLANPPSCITAIYTTNKAGIECQYSVQIRNTHSATIPTPMTSNL